MGAYGNTKLADVGNPVVRNDTKVLQLCYIYEWERGYDCAAQLIISYPDSLAPQDVDAGVGGEANPLADVA